MTEEQGATLRGWLGAGKTEQRMAFRAEVILAIAEGLSNQAVAEQHLHEAGDALGEFTEGLIWLLVLQGRFALEKGDLTAARATIQEGLTLAEQTDAVWQAARLTPVLAAIETMNETAVRRDELRIGLLLGRPKRPDVVALTVTNQTGTMPSLFLRKLIKCVRTFDWVAP